MGEYKKDYSLEDLRECLEGFSDRCDIDGFDVEDLRIEVEDTWLELLSYIEVLEERLVQMQGKIEVLERKTEWFGEQKNGCRCKKKE